jgi:DNA damage-inducible protein 1
MLAVVIRQARPPPNAQQANRQRNAGRAAGGPDPEALRQQLLRDPRQLANVRNQDPELAAAVMDPNRWAQTWEHKQRQQQEAEQERRNQIALLNEDPFNVDAQRKIEELIRQDRVVENLEKAYNENPEGRSCFVSITGLC